MTYIPGHNNSIIAGATCVLISFPGSCQVLYYLYLRGLVFEVCKRKQHSIVTQPTFNNFDGSLPTTLQNTITLPKKKHYPNRQNGQNPPPRPNYNLQ
jgi:hypothetical protein